MKRDLTRSQLSVDGGENNHDQFRYSRGESCKATKVPVDDDENVNAESDDSMMEADKADKTSLSASPGKKPKKSTKKVKKLRVIFNICCKEFLFRISLLSVLEI